MKYFSLIAFSILSVNLYAQLPDSIKVLSDKWKADSSGSAGIRKSYVQETAKGVMVFHLNIVGYPIDKTMELLGKPNENTTFKNRPYDCVYTYYLGKDSSGFLNIFSIDILKNKVIDAFMGPRISPISVQEAKTSGK